MSNLNSDFWNIVGNTVSWRDLEVGEVFLLEQGPIRQIMKVVAMDEESFDCHLAFGESLPERHKVLVIGRDDD